MTLKSGTVSAVSRKKSSNGKDMYSVKIDEEWYSAFGTTEINKGDVVEMDWKQNGDFKNITTIKVTEKSKVQNIQSGIDENARLRRMTDLLLKACDMCIAGKVRLDEINKTLISLMSILNNTANPIEVELSKPATIEKVKIE